MSYYDDDEEFVDESEYVEGDSKPHRHESLMENDEVSPEEEAFMKGYEEAVEEKEEDEEPPQ